MTSRTPWPRLTETGVAIAAAALLGGCGPTTHTTTTPASGETGIPATTVPGASTSTAPSSSTSVPPGATPTTTASSSGVAACVTDHLTVSLGRGDAGAGHTGDTLLFRNTGTTACDLYGYPGVALLNASGKQVVQATRTLSGYLGGLTAGTKLPPVLTVRAGATVSALLEGTDVPTGASTHCTQFTGLLVTPPNQTVSVSLSLAKRATGLAEPMPGCSTPEIHPVVAGSTGSAA